MKKLIVKTALVTLGSLLAVFLLLLTAMTMYAPRTMASLLDSVGNRSLSLWYTELAYQKFGETDDLTDVFDKAVAAEDTERTVKYGRTADRARRLRRNLRRAGRLGRQDYL